jgi:hypothetical protein
MLPPTPVLPDDQRGSGTYRLRFEDLSQDGRILFEPIVASVGASVWRPLLEKHPVAAILQAHDIRPIFTRLALDATSATLSLGEPLTAEGAYELAYEPDAAGGVVRMYLNMWTQVWGIGRGGTEIEGKRVLAGRLFAEHVLTRLRATAEQRRVTEIPGVPRPTAQYRQPPREELLELPQPVASTEPAAWLEPVPRADAVPTVFGLMHTDTNQHVNSLVYPRLFEEAALRRLRDLGKGSRVLGRSLEVAFRKPFFGGDAASIVLRAFASGDRLGVTGVFGDTASPEGKPHAYVRIMVEP